MAVGLAASALGLAWTAPALGAPQTALAKAAAAKAAPTSAAGGSAKPRTHPASSSAGAAPSRPTSSASAKGSPPPKAPSSPKSSQGGADQSAARGGAAERDKSPAESRRPQSAAGTKPHQPGGQRPSPSASHQAAGGGSGEANKSHSSSQQKASSRSGGEPEGNATAEAAKRAGSEAAGEGAASGAAAGEGAAANSTESRQEQARWRFEQGASAFADKRNAEAAYHFDQAARLLPNPRLSYNLGLVHEEMGNLGEAISRFRDYLHSDEQGPERGQAEKRVRALEARLQALGVQQLRIDSVPSGATIQIDGRLVGVTPKALLLRPGQYEVRLASSGHRAERVLVHLSADQSTRIVPQLKPEGKAPAPAPERPRVQPLTWGLLGVGVGALVGATAFEWSRAAATKRAREREDPELAALARGEARGKKAAAMTLYGFGGGFLIAGSVLLAADWLRPDGGRGPDQDRGSRRPRKDAPKAAVWCGPSGCGVQTRLTF